MFLRLEGAYFQKLWGPAVPVLHAKFLAQLLDHKNHQHQVPHITSPLALSTSFNSCHNPKSRFYLYHPDFTKEKNKAQRGDVTCPRSHSKQEAEPLGTQVHLNRRGSQMAKGTSTSPTVPTTAREAGRRAGIGAAQQEIAFSTPVPALHRTGC